MSDLERIENEARERRGQTFKPDGSVWGTSEKMRQAEAAVDELLDIAKGWERAYHSAEQNTATKLEVFERLNKALAAARALREYVIKDWTGQMLEKVDTLERVLADTAWVEET